MGRVVPVTNGCGRRAAGISTRSGGTALDTGSKSADSCSKEYLMMRTRILPALAVGLALLATPAWADFKMERRLALEPGGTFTLQSDVGGVTVSGDSTSGATVTITSRRDDFEKLFDLRFEDTAGGATVIVKRRGGRPKGFWNDWSDDNTHFVVHVPSQTAVSVSTSGGSIDASSSGGNVESDVPVTIQGRIDRDSLRGDLNGGGALLRLRSSGGGVRILPAR
jgi:hypothetical protein